MPAFFYVGSALRIIRDERLYRGGLTPEQAERFAECEAIIRRYRPEEGRSRAAGIKRSDPRPHSVYVHLAADGTVLYVGISLDAIQRTAAHRNGGWWEQVASIRIERLPDRAAALAREAELIAELKPIYNRDGVL